MGGDHLEHVHLAEAADLAIVAPATANVIGKLAGGIADDFLSTELMAMTCPIVLAPAMNVNMMESQAVTANVELLLRALEVYEVDRLDFAEAYLVAAAELTGAESIASFDKTIDRVASVERLVP